MKALVADAVIILHCFIELLSLLPLILRGKSTNIHVTILEKFCLRCGANLGIRRMFRVTPLILLVKRSQIAKPAVTLITLTTAAVTTIAVTTIAMTTAAVTAAER